MDINAKLVVDSVTVPIKSFSFQAPTGRLGTLLNVQLARPDSTVIAPRASVKFSLIITIAGTPNEYVLMENGKVQTRDDVTGFNQKPIDEVSFAAVDILADKFSLGPRRPVIMFDPNRVRYDNVLTRRDQLIRNEDYSLVDPIIEPVVGLTMHQILDRAYTGHGGFLYLSPYTPTGFTWGPLLSTSDTDQLGCGFSRVITNIPDYPVRRADFTIESGWHGGAQPVVQMFSPVYFVHGTVLFILDVEQPLPAGINAYYVPLSTHKNLDEHIEYKPDTNAILLTYQYNGNDPSEDPARLSRDVFNDETIDTQGTTGEDGYSRTTVQRWDREFYLSDAPDAVLDKLPLSTTTETEMTITFRDSAGSTVNLGIFITHREVAEYFYEGDLKTGHRKVIEALFVDPTSSFVASLRTVEEETCHISWVEDTNNPGMKVQDRSTTYVEGLTAWDSTHTETVDYGGGPTTVVRQIPILLALSSGLSPQLTDIMDQLVPIKTIRETLHVQKGNQIDMEVVEVDHLNNTLKRSYTQPVTGTTHHDPYESKSRTILLRDTASEASIGARIPEQVNAYELPREMAIALGHRSLKRLTNPLRTLPIALPGVDLAIARGSVIQGQKRATNTTRYFVTGFSITGNNLGQTGHRISESLEAVEIGTATA